MTRIVKQRELAALNVRPLDSIARTAAPVQPVEVLEDPELTTLRLRCAELSRQLDAGRDDIQVLRREIERAFSEGEDVGRKLGRDEAEDMRTSALARLDAAVAQALVAFSQEMKALESLAPLLAREALKLILEEDADRSRLMEGVIRRQLQRLGEQVVLKIEVSRDDFAEPLDLAGKLGRDTVEVHASDVLSSGDCRIRLRLGSLDIGLRQQWGRLSALLEDMAQAEAVQ
jgi:flagellar biosynthesis/type III secretory pathway protein FliH